MLNKINYIFTKGDKRTVLKLFILTLVGSVMELLGVTIFLPFINVIMNPESIQKTAILKWTYDLGGFTTVKGYMLFLCIVIIVIYIVKNIFLIYQKNVTYSFSFQIQKDLATKLLNSYMKQPYTFHLKKNIAEMQRSLESDIAKFSQFVMQSLELMSEIGVCLLMGIFLLSISKTITIVVVGLLIICVMGFALGTKKVSEGLGKQCQGYKAKIYQWINQSLGGIKELKILNREEYFLNLYNDYYEKYAKALRILKIISMVPKYIVEAVCITGLVIAIIIKLLFGEADMIYYIPQLAVFATAAFRLLPSVGRINGYLTEILSSLPSVDLVYHDLKEVDEYEIVMGKEEDYKFNFQNAIYIKNLSYRYPDGVEDVLHNVNLSIQKGKTVAFIGSSGAGKTTMVDIILGLLRPNDGNVFADEMNVHKNLNKWHKQIGYIPQTIYLADDSIRANIAFGVNEGDIEEDAVVRAIKQAQLDEFISTLPEGLNSFVGDRGVRLSGGQKQRIGIARALYHNPEILVLDEATSALDNETETAVMESIDCLQGMKTMIIIAHRLTTIRNADIIYEVIDGNVIERNKKEIFDEESVKSNSKV